MVDAHPTNGGGAPRANFGEGGVYAAIRCVDAPRVHRDIGSIAPDAPLYDAVNHMWWRQRGAIAVADGEALVGSLSEDDLLRVAHAALIKDRDLTEAKGANFLVWEELLRDLRVSDAMSALDDMAVVDEEASLLEGIQQTTLEKSSGARRRYIYVVGPGQELVRVVSMRDVCRYLIAVYDGGPAAAELPLPEPDGVGRIVREALDLPVGLIRANRKLGHTPVSASIEDSGVAGLQKMWEGRRGYVLVSFFDGAPQGICTRRDLLRALRRPFSSLRDLAVANLMSAQVKAASRLITLGGVFKLMAIGGYRHLPLLEPDGQVECVISMWEGVSLLASGDSPY